MAQQILPVTNAPNQQFTASLLVDGQQLILIITLRYNEIASIWEMTVQSQQGTLLLDSVPLVTGNDPACNILRQFSYMQIGSCFVINQSGAITPNTPDNFTLGTNFAMVWGDTP